MQPNNSLIDLAPTLQCCNIAELCISAGYQHAKMETKKYDKNQGGDIYPKRP